MIEQEAPTPTSQLLLIELESYQPVSSPLLFKLPTELQITEIIILEEKQASLRGLRSEIGNLSSSPALQVSGTGLLRPGSAIVANKKRFIRLDSIRPQEVIMRH